VFFRILLPSEKKSFILNGRADNKINIALEMIDKLISIRNSDSKANKIYTKVFMT